MTIQSSGKSSSTFNNFVKNTFSPFHFPLKYQWILSCILLIFAIAITLPPPPLIPDVPVFQAARQEDGRHFGNDRMERAPILYGWIHTLGGAIWCVLIPLQHTKYIRRNYPKFHRISGRMIVFVSFAMTISGTIFIPLNLAYSAPVFHLHRLRIGKGDEKYTILAWPTFEAAVYALGLPFSYAALQTIRTARAKDFKEHQGWASILTIIGYMVPTQRAFMFVIAFIGFGFLPNLSSEWRDFLNVPKDLKGKSDAEKAGFAWTTWMAYLTLSVYTIIQQSKIRRESMKLKKGG